MKGRSFNEFVSYFFSIALCKLIPSSSNISGGDVHAATDGNFHHRHLSRAGDSPSFYEPDYFISKEQVDAVGDRIERARKRPVRTYNAKVPDSAIDECEDSHEAADGRKEKTSGAHFDARGLMALVCRHDIALFFANIDTPGEQQKYAVALVEHLYSLLPEVATVAILYDVGCILDRSLKLVSVSVCIILRHSFNRYVVRYITAQTYISTSTRNFGDACIWSSMGMPADIQPSTAPRTWFDGWRGYREVVVKIAETHPHHQRLCSKQTSCFMSIANCFVHSYHAVSGSWTGTLIP